MDRRDRETSIGAGARPPHQPVRVMHVLYRLQAGGTEYGVIKVVNGLDPHEVTSSICSTTPATEVKRLLRPEVRLHECTRRDGNDPSLVWQLFRLFRRERPHIVHTHAWGTLCEGLLAARLARVPVVVHGEHGTLQLKPYQARAQRFAWNHVDRLLSVSSRLAERMSAATEFPLERIRVIRNGVDLSRFAAVDRVEARRALGLGDGVLAIGTAGRLVPVKDQTSLISALADLASRGVRFVGVIAGDGPLRQELEAHASALGIADRVTFLGHRADVERVYAALDIFVLPSVSEGLSNTILEAMASGLPVVATRVGGADELIDEGVTGLLVPASARDALSNAIEVLVRDEPRRLAMGRAARERSESLFGLRRMLADYQAAYVELCGQSNAVMQRALA
jgi:sugar transferase (PEP-CTERM/EpsH1 system associated)